MQQNEPECHAEKNVCCLQGQGHSEDLYNQTVTLTTTTSELLTFCQLDLVG